MNMKRVLNVSALLLMCVVAAPSFASSFTYTATLKGSNEVPPTPSTGTGFATYTLTGDMLTVDVMFAGISAPALAAHIHCCAPLGSNAPVVLPFAGFPNATSGTYLNTFNLSTFVFSGGGSEAALIAGLNSGQAYTNIHDMNFLGGEIEGQIEPSTVPEPGSLMLMATGLAGVAGAVRRRMMA